MKRFAAAFIFISRKRDSLLNTINRALQISGRRPAQGESQNANIFFVIAFCLLTLFVVPLTKPVFAASNWLDASYAQAFDCVRKGTCTNSEAFTARQFSTVLVSFGNLISCDEFCSEDPQIRTALNRSTALGVTNNALSSVFKTPPASFGYWLADASRSIGIGPKQVYAQEAGIGFAGLAPLLPLWKIFRNIAYLFLAIIMVAIGFMVMFRQKIDPKTVVTVQNALPRIVLTLILITFSYAIVGTLIDVMYISILLITSLVQSTGLLQLSDLSKSLFTAANMKSLEQLYTTGGLYANLMNVPFTADALFGLQPGALLGGGVGTGVGIVGIIIGATTGTPIVTVGSAIALAPVLIDFVIKVALFLLMINLLFFFFGSYVQIILDLIFGPIQILFEAIPGTNAFSSWFKDVLANILVFPIGSFMFMLATIIYKFGADQGAFWNPPYGVLITSNTRAVTALLSLGILFTIPKICNKAKEVFKAKPAVEAGLGNVTGVFGGPFQLLMQGYQFWSSYQTSKYLRKQAGFKDESHG